jgi:hypothetical protein
VFFTPVANPQMGIWIGGVGQEVILSVTSFYNYLRPVIIERFGKKSEQLLYLDLACELDTLASGRVANCFQIFLYQLAPTLLLLQTAAMQKKI